MCHTGARQLITKAWLSTQETAQQFSTEHSVVSKMWLQLVVALLSGATISQAEVFDVTTIYDLDDSNQNATGHVHVRTNALGLAVSNGKGVTLTSENPQHFHLHCDASEFKKCTWDIGTNYSVGSRASKKIIPEQEHDMTDNLISIGFENPTKPLKDEYLFIGIEKHTTSEDPNRKPFYVLEWHVSYLSLSIHMYGDCSNNCGYNDYDYYNGYYSRSTNRVDLKNQYKMFTVCCQQKTSLYVTDHLDIDTGNNFILFNVTGNELNIYHKSYSTLIRKIHIDSPKLYFRTYFGSNSHHNSLIFGTPVLETTTNGAEMASPPLLPLKGTDQICLTVVLYCHEYSKQDVLHLLARDLFNTDHFLHAFSNVKVGWNVKQVHINITKEIIRPFRIVIRNLGNISIARISSCDLDGEEVWPIETVEKSSLLNLYSNPEKLNSTWKYIYNAKLSALGQPEYILIENGLANDCQNGGVMTTDGCACPPGFTGSVCQIGCGPNRFGLDCRGLCSKRTKMCKELLMCNSATGCHCAPGYKQENCSHQCERGEYGNNCKQTCGHCLSRGECDIYTGECQACEPGYVPPYCKEAYVYYASKPELSSLDYGTITVKFIPNNITGVGIPELYQIQYRLKFTPEWYIYTSKNIEKSDDKTEGYKQNAMNLFNKSETIIEERIEGLKAGYLYEVRVVLMDASFNEYNGDLIQVSEILTKCDIPDTVNYNLKAVSTSESIRFSWSYVNESIHWCSVEKYEVSWKEDWRWITTYTQDEVFILNNLLPNSSIKFRVRAKTNGGYTPSSELVAYTHYKGSHKVRDLRMVNSYTTSVRISWNPPIDDDRHLKYIITFRCDKQLACPPGCDNATEGTFTQDQTSVTLSPLLPFAKYYVTVAPEDGPQSGIYIGTLKTEPTEIVRLSAKGVLRTNTSLVVSWEPVPVCSSFHLGYKYYLHKESDTNKILASGSTKTLSVTFDNLVASTHYSVRVFVVTIAGWNPDAFLDISTSTSATVPEAVRNLTVYKCARNSLGLRWAAPRVSYGRLKTFTISYFLSEKEHSESVEPTSCVPWPHLYCHTLQGLRPNRKYNVSVSARNSEVAEDGAKTSVTGITKESLPSAPEGLKLTNSTSTSVSVEWHYPDIPNGTIRSFLVSVEETEQFNQDDCCQVFPLVESSVQEELPSYNSEVSGLHPASTYFVSVSAKTVGMGPSQLLVVHTKPPHLPFSILPNQSKLSSEGTWLPQVTRPQLLNNSMIFQPLIKAHLLLLVEDTEAGPRNDSGISNPQLNALLQNLIGKPFYFYTEYTEENQDVFLTIAPEVDNSAWGTCPDPSILSVQDSYKLAAAQVSEYGSEFNVDLCYLSQPITLE